MRRALQQAYLLAELPGTSAETTSRSSAPAHSDGAGLEQQDVMGNQLRTLCHCEGEREGDAKFDDRSPFPPSANVTCKRCSRDGAFSLVPLSTGLNPTQSDAEPQML